MKKLAFCAAAAAVCGSLLAVESANIVGYNTITINKQYTLLTVNFDDVAGGALDIQKAFPYCEGMTKGQSDSSADNIQIMTEDGNYEIYFLSNGKYGKGGSSYNAELDGKWSKTGQATVAAKDLASGTTFWYLSRSGAATPFTMTVAGAVNNSASETYDITKSYTLIGCPYPCDVAINGGIVVTGGTTGQSDSSADNIQIMTDDGNYEIYFLSNGKYGKGGASYNAELDGKWSKTGQAAVTTDTFPTGKGAFYLSRSKSGSVKFVSPFAKTTEE